MNTVESDLVNPFRNGTILVLSTKCKVEAVPRLHYCREDKEKPDHEVVSMLGIAGENYGGFLNFRSTKEFHLRLINKMMGTHHQKINPQIQTGAGDLLHSIFCRAKIELLEKGHKLCSIPVFLSGTVSERLPLEKTRLIVVPFECAFEVFYLELCIELTA